MATSLLALRLRNERCSLLSRLIATLLGSQPGDDDHKLALEFCMHHTHVHGFLDTNPAAVDEEYRGCGAAVLKRCRWLCQHMLDACADTFKSYWQQSLAQHASIVPV